MLQSIVYVVLGFFVINLIIFVHEAVHYVAARMAKVDIQVVSFGVGPAVFARTGRNSITEIRVSMLPLGGYCRMAGAKDLKRSKGSDRITRVTPGSMYSVSPFARMMIYFFGPLFNFLFAVLLLFLFYVLPARAAGGVARVVRFDRERAVDPRVSFVDGDVVIGIDGEGVSDFQDLYGRLKAAAATGRAVDAEILRDGKRISARIAPEPYGDGGFSFGITKYEEMSVGRVSHRGREYAAGLREGDFITSVNGRELLNSADFFSEVGKRSGATVTFGVLRSGERTEIAFVPRRDADGAIRFDFALGGETAAAAGRPAGSALLAAAGDAFSFARGTFSSLFSVFDDANSMKDTFSGPMRASGAIGEITDVGRSVSFMSAVRAALYMAAMVSASLCVINLLPLPSLDGGGIVVGVFESFSRDGLLSVRAYRVINVLSFVTTVVLMALIWVSDLLSKVG